MKKKRSRVLILLILILFSIVVYNPIKTGLQSMADTDNYKEIPMHSLIYSDNDAIYFTGNVNGYMNILGNTKLEGFQSVDTLIATEQNSVDLFYNAGFKGSTAKRCLEPFVAMDGNFAITSTRAYYANKYSADGKVSKEPSSDLYAKAVDDTNNTAFFLNGNTSGYSTHRVTAYGYVKDLNISKKNRIQYLEMSAKLEDLPVKQFVALDAQEASGTSSFFVTENTNNSIGGSPLYVMGTQAQEGAAKSFYSSGQLPIVRFNNMLSDLEFYSAKSCYASGGNYVSKNNYIYESGSYEGPQNIVLPADFVNVKGSTTTVFNNGEEIATYDTGSDKLRALEVGTNASIVVTPTTVRNPVDLLDKWTTDSEGNTVKLCTNLRIHNYAPYYTYHGQNIYFTTGTISFTDYVGDEIYSTTFTAKDDGDGNYATDTLIDADLIRNARYCHVTFDPITIDMSVDYVPYLHITKFSDGTTCSVKDMQGTDDFVIVKNYDGSAWAIGANPSNVWGLTTGEVKEYYTEFVKLPYDYDDIVYINDIARVINSGSGRTYYASNNCFANADKAILDTIEEFYVCKTEAVGRDSDDYIYYFFGNKVNSNNAIYFNNYHIADGKISEGNVLGYSSVPKLYVNDTAIKLNGSNQNGSLLYTKNHVGTNTVSFKYEISGEVHEAFSGTFEGTAPKTAVVNEEHGTLSINLPVKDKDFELYIDGELSDVLNQAGSEAKIYTSLLEQGSHTIKIVSKDNGEVIYDGTKTVRAMQFPIASEGYTPHFVNYLNNMGDYAAFTLTNYARDGYSFSTDDGATWTDWIYNPNYLYFPWTKPKFTLLVRVKNNPAGEDVITYTEEVDLTEKLAEQEKFSSFPEPPNSVTSDALPVYPTTNSSSPYKVFFNWSGYDAIAYTGQASHESNISDSMKPEGTLYWYKIDDEPWKILYPNNNSLYSTNGYGTSGKTYFTCSSGTHKVQLRLGKNQMCYQGYVNVYDGFGITFNSSKNKFVLSASPDMDDSKIDFSFDGTNFYSADKLPVPETAGTYEIMGRYKDTIVETSSVEVNPSELQKPEIVKVDDNHFYVNAYYGETLTYTIDYGVVHNLIAMNEQGEDAAPEAMLEEGTHTVTVYADGSEVGSIELTYTVEDSAEDDELDLVSDKFTYESFVTVKKVATNKFIVNSTHNEVVSYQINGEGEKHSVVSGEEVVIEDVDMTKITFSINGDNSCYELPMTYSLTSDNTCTEETFTVNYTGHYDLNQVHDDQFIITSDCNEDISYSLNHNDTVFDIVSGEVNYMNLDGSYTANVTINGDTCYDLQLKHKTAKKAPKLLEDFSMLTGTYKTYYQDGYNLKVLGIQEIADIATTYKPSLDYKINYVNSTSAMFRTYKHFTKLFNLNKYGYSKVIDIQNGYFRTEDNTIFSYGVREPIPVTVNKATYNLPVYPSSDLSIFYPIIHANYMDEFGVTCEKAGNFVSDSNNIAKYFYAGSKLRSTGAGVYEGGTLCYEKNKDYTSTILSKMEELSVSKLKEVKSYAYDIDNFVEKSAFWLVGSYRGIPLKVLSLDEDGTLVFCSTNDVVSSTESISSGYCINKLADNVVDYTLCRTAYYGLCCYVPVYIQSDGSVTWKGSEITAGPTLDYTFTASDLGSPAIKLSDNGYVLTEEGKVFDIHTGEAVEIASDAVEIVSEYYLSTDGQVYNYNGEMEPVDYKTTKDIGIQLDELDIDCDVEHIVLTVPSGFTSVKLPDGTEKSASAGILTYDVYKNGDYVFEFTNKYGDVSKKLSKIYNITDRITEVPQINALNDDVTIKLPDNTINKGLLSLAFSKDNETWTDVEDGYNFKYEDTFYVKVLKKGYPGHTLKVTENNQKDGKISLTVIDLDENKYQVAAEDYVMDGSKYGDGEYGNGSRIVIPYYRSVDGSFRNIANDDTLKMPNSFMQGTEDRYIDSSYTLHQKNVTASRMERLLQATSNNPPAYVGFIYNNYEYYLEALGIGQIAKVADGFVLTTEGEIFNLSRNYSSDGLGTDPTAASDVSVDILPNGEPSSYIPTGYYVATPNPVSNVRGWYNYCVASWQWLNTEFSTNLTETGFYYTEDKKRHDDIVNSVYYKISGYFSSEDTAIGDNALIMKDISYRHPNGYSNIHRSSFPLFYTVDNKIYWNVQAGNLVVSSGAPAEAVIAARDSCSFPVPVVNRLGEDISDEVKVLRFSTYITENYDDLDYNRFYISYFKEGAQIGDSKRTLPFVMVDSEGKTYDWDRGAHSFRERPIQLNVAIPNVSYTLDDISWTNENVNVDVKSNQLTTADTVTLAGDLNGSVVNKQISDTVSTSVEYIDKYAVKIEGNSRVTNSTNIHVNNIDKIAPTVPTYDAANRIFVDGEDPDDETQKYATSGVDYTEISLDGEEWYKQNEVSLTSLIAAQEEKEEERNAFSSVKNFFSNLFNIITTSAVTEDDTNSYYVYARTYDKAGNVSDTVQVSVDDVINETFIYSLGETEVEFEADFSFNNSNASADHYKYLEGEKAESDYSSALDGDSFVVTEDSTYTLFAEKDGNIVYKVVNVKVIDIKAPTITHNSTDKSKADIVAGECINSEFDTLYYRVNYGSWESSKKKEVQADLVHGDNHIEAYTVNDYGFIGPKTEADIHADLVSTDPPVITVTDKGNVTIEPGEIIGDTLYKIYYTTDDWETTKEYTEGFKVAGDYEIKAYQETYTYHVISDEAVETGTIIDHTFDLSVNISYKSGKPISNQKVKVVKDDTENEQVTDSNGNLKIPDQGNGEYKITSIHKDNTILNVTATIDNEVNNSDIKLGKIINSTQKYEYDGTNLAITVSVNDAIEGEVFNNNSYENGSTDVEITSEITENDESVIAETHKYLKGRHNADDIKDAETGSSFTAEESDYYTIYAVYKGEVFFKVIYVNVYTLDNTPTYDNGKTTVDFNEHDDPEYKYEYSYKDNDEDVPGHQIVTNEDKTVVIKTSIDDDIVITDEVDIIVVSSGEPVITVDKDGDTTITPGLITHDTLDKIYYQVNNGEWLEYNGKFTVTDDYVINAYQTTVTYKISSNIATVSGSIKDEVPSTEVPSTETPSTEAPTTETPTTEVPTTETPTTEVSTTEAPATTQSYTWEEATTEKVTTEETTTEEATTEESLQETIKENKKPVYRLVIPKTGDNKPIIIVICLNIFSLLVLLLVLFKKKK